MFIYYYLDVITLGILHTGLGIIMGKFKKYRGMIKHLTKLVHDLYIAIF